MPGPTPPPSAQNSLDRPRRQSRLFRDGPRETEAWLNTPSKPARKTRGHRNDKSFCPAGHNPKLRLQQSAQWPGKPVVAAFFPRHNSSSPVAVVGNSRPNRHSIQSVAPGEHGLVRGHRIVPARCAQLSRWFPTPHTGDGKEKLSRLSPDLVNAHRHRLTAPVRCRRPPRRPGGHIAVVPVCGLALGDQHGGAIARGLPAVSSRLQDGPLVV